MLEYCGPTTRDGLMYGEHVAVLPGGEGYWKRVGVLMAMGWQVWVIHTRELRPIAGGCVCDACTDPSKPVA